VEYPRDARTYPRGRSRASASLGQVRRCGLVPLSLSLPPSLALPVCTCACACACSRLSKPLTQARQRAQRTWSLAHTRAHTRERTHESAHRRGRLGRPVGGSGLRRRRRRRPPATIMVLARPTGSRDAAALRWDRLPSANGPSRPLEPGAGAALAPRRGGRPNLPPGLGERLGLHYVSLYRSTPRGVHCVGS
jgi:hypothetical protein